MAQEPCDAAASCLPTDPSGRALLSFQSGKGAWPQLTLDFPAFCRYFTRHTTSGTPPHEAHAADMYLACACAEGDEKALVVLERLLTGGVARAVASVDSADAFVDEILQMVRERLLVRRGAEPAKIVEYGGRASLKSWMCTVAVRLAISTKRRGGGRGEHLSLGDDRRLANSSPEFEYLRGRYKTVFEDAVRSAIEQMPSKQRMLLRLNLVEGMSIDELATIYDVGRSTAARWLSSARDNLLDCARRELRAKLNLTAAELESLAADLRSQLDVSMLRLLAGADI